MIWRLLLSGIVMVSLWAQPAWSQTRLDLKAQTEQISTHFRSVVGQRIIRPPEILCDVSVCKEVETEQVLKDLAGLPPGSVVETDALVEAWARLMRTGFFSRILVEPMQDDGLGVRFRCVGNVVITHLQVVYDDWHSFVYPKQFVAEVRKRIPLRIGGSFPPQRKNGEYAEQDAARLAEYERRIQSLYEEQGYLGTIVRIRPHYYGENNKKVRIKIRLNEGTQPRLGQILIRGAKAFPYWKIVSKLSTGERTDFLKDIFSLFGVGTYSRRQLKEELAAVEVMYRDEGYVTARVRLESKPAKKRGLIYPRVRIYEGPKLTVKFEGNTRLKDSALKEVMTFTTNGSFDDTEVEASRRAIVSAYQAIARYYVEVVAEKVRVDEENFEVIYRIEEGPRVYIRRVEIVGARKLKKLDVLAAMETKGVAEDGVLSALGTSEGIVQDERIINDMTAIRTLYRNHGMPGLRFRCARPGMAVDEWTTIKQLPESGYEGEGPKISPELFRSRFDVWSDNPIRNHCYQIIPDEDPRLVTLRIEIDEGLRTTAQRVRLWRLIKREMDESMRDEIYALLEKQGFVNEFRRWKGSVDINQRKLDAVRGFLLRHYHQEGYLAARVDPMCFVEDDPDRTDCSEERLYGAKIKTLSFDIEKGPRTRVKGVILRGNLRTQDHIILDELLLKNGKALGSDALFISQANLRSLGIFDAVNVEYISHDAKEVEEGADRNATVVVTVEETNPQKIDLYFGFKVDSTPFGEDEELPVLYTIGGAYRHRNIAGYAIEGGFGTKHSNRIDKPQEVSGDEAVWQAGPFLKNRRFFGTRLDLVTEALFQRGQTGQRDAYQHVLNAQSTIGYDFYNLSYPATWGRGLRASLKTEFRHEQIRPLSRQDEIPPFNDPTDSLTIQPVLSWDHRDNPLHPTKGFLILASAEVLIPSLLDWSDVPIKTTLTTQIVHSVFKRKLIFVPNLRIGSVWTHKKQDELKSGFLFKAGGDGVSFPVRGFADASIDACRGIENRRFGTFCEDVFPPGVTVDDEFAEPATIGGKSMVLGGLEVRFPTFLVDNFWFAVFGDFGAIAPNWRYIDRGAFQGSVGGGLRMLVSGQIPLRFDLAYPLTQTPFSEQDLRLHVNIFYQL